MSEQATLNIYGAGLTANAFATGQRGNYNGTFYHVNGALSDGTALRDFILFDADTGSSNPGRNCNLVVVPEPSAIMLLFSMGLGTYLWRKRKHQPRKRCQG